MRKCDTFPKWPGILVFNLLWCEVFSFVQRIWSAIKPTVVASFLKPSVLYKENQHFKHKDKTWRLWSNSRSHCNYNLPTELKISCALSRLKCILFFFCRTWNTATYCSQEVNTTRMVKSFLFRAFLGSLYFPNQESFLFFRRQQLAASLQRHGGFRTRAAPHKLGPVLGSARHGILDVRWETSHRFPKELSTASLKCLKHKETHMFSGIDGCKLLWMVAVSKLLGEFWCTIYLCKKQKHLSLFQILCGCGTNWSILLFRENEICWLSMIIHL